MSETRRCSVPDCSTVLSDYNPHDRCWEHQPRAFASDRSRCQIVAPVRAAYEPFTQAEQDRYWEGRW